MPLMGTNTTPKLLVPHAWLTNWLLAEDSTNYGPNVQQMF